MLKEPWTAFKALVAARTALLALAGAEFHLLGVSSHLAGARPSFALSQMKGQGWITGKHGPVELRTDDFKSTSYWAEYLEAGLYKELRLVGH